MFKGVVFFFQFGWKSKKQYIIYLILNQFIESMIPIIGAIMPKFIIDELMGEIRINYIIIYTLVLLLYTLFASILSNFLVKQSFTYRSEVAADFDNFMHKKIVKANYANLESSEYIEMKERADKFLFGDMKGFSYVLDLSIGIIGKIFTLLGVITIIATLHPLFVFFFIIITFGNSYIESKTRKKQIEIELEMTQEERRWTYYGEVMENFVYGKEIRINNLGEWLIQKEKQFAKKINSKRAYSNKLGIKSGIVTSFSLFLQQSMAYVYILSLILNNKLTIGDFTMYISSIILFSTAMTAVMSSIVELSSYGKYYDAMEQYLNIPDSMYDNTTKHIEDRVHNIEFKNVSFIYPGQTRYALRNINIKINSGEKLAIVGENGSGKTTFVKLLCRIYDPTEGEILFDGINIKEIKYDEYMSMFSTVFQDYKLFSFTLKENITLSDITKEKDAVVEEVLNKAGFGEKLCKLQKGIYTNIYKNFDDEGFEPSGGEGQKIALARALYKNAPIVVLDEPTAALDPKSEYEMYQKFNDLVYHKTAIFITHRLASTQFCDYIVVFQNGEICEYGTHNQLIQKKKIYYELYSMQANLYTK